MNFNFTIQNKLIASFAIVIIGVLFLGFKSVTEMNMLSGLTAKMYKHPLTVTKASLEADTAIIKIHRSMKDVALAQNKQAMAKAVAAVDQYEQLVFDKLAIVQEFILGKEGEQLIAQTINTFKKWKPIRQEVIDFMKAGDRQAASAITKEKGAAHVQKIAEKMKALTDYAGIKASGFNNNAKSIYDDAVIVMLVIIALLCVIGLVVAVILIKHITQPLNELQSTIESIEKSSDLTQSVKIYRDDEFGSIANRFNTMINTFKLAITQVATSSTEVAQAAGHASTLNSNTRDSIISQNDQLHQLAASIEEMSASITEVARNTASAATSAEEADKETVLGSQLVQQTAKTVNEVNAEILGVGESVKQLEVQGQNVTSVLGVIKSIAEQTNLLALNAAIEAARAGEQGRGFAVVADEVRTLAQRTQSSTSEIETMLSEFNSEIQHAITAISSGQKKVNECVNQAENATKSLNNIIAAVDTIKQMSDQIACAAKEQNTVTEEVTRTISSISKDSAKTLDDATESSSAITQQAKMADELKLLSSQFTY